MLFILLVSLQIRLVVREALLCICFESIVDPLTERFKGLAAGLNEIDVEFELTLVIEPEIIDILPIEELQMGWGNSGVVSAPDWVEWSK